MAMSMGLRERLLLELPTKLTRLQPANIDYRRALYGQSTRSKVEVGLRLITGEVLRRLSHRAGVVRWSAQHAAHLEARLATYLGMMGDLELLYEGLEDDHSRDTLVEVIAYRILGARHARMSRNAGAYWQRYRSLDKLREGRERMTAGGLALLKFAVPLAEHGTVSLFADPIAVFHTFLMRQYVLDRPGLSVAPRAGDVVIDGGGCWGDASLFFASLVGPRGKVIVFEFVADQLRVLERNLTLNAALAPRIELVRRPMWSRRDEQVRFQASGPGSRIGAGGEAIATETLDHVVRERGLSRVDFLKLDLEGSELAALEGSRETLLRFRPRLALSVYHRDDDLQRIPAFFRELGIEYRWALDHFTIHSEETILFGLPRA